MIYRHIPGTDLEPSAICLGCGSLGSRVNSEHPFELLDAFEEMGGNFIDTAHSYGSSIHEKESLSERTIGTWLSERGNRKKIVLGTKGGHPDFDSMNVMRLSHDEIVSDLNESLQCLQADYIDLYWLHRDDPNRPVSEIIETLNELVEASQIRYFGCSNWKINRIQEALEYASERDLKCFVANQMMWSLATPTAEAIEMNLVAMDDEGMEFHKKSGMAAIPYSSQAKGFFSKISRGEIAQLSEYARNLYYNEENMRRLERVKILAHRLSRSTTEIALSYLISQPFTTIPIVGCQRLEHLKDSLKAADLLLDHKMVRYLEQGS